MARGTVPHYLPGQNLLPEQDPETTDRFGTPFEARLGGAHTMYPEYIATMKTFPRLAATPAPAGPTEREP